MPVVAVLLAGGSGWLFVSLGHILHDEDPLEPADVIFVLGGEHLNRVAEAGHLYLEGWAPRIVLSGHSPDRAEVALGRQGLQIISVADIQVDTLVQMGVPRDAIGVLGAAQDTTAGESAALRRRFPAEGWTRIVIVTARLHTARARLVMGRYFAGTGVRLIMRATRYDDARVERWWSSRRDLRFALFEAQKLFAYWIGAAD